MSTESYPMTTKLDGMPAIIARDIVVCNLRFYMNIFIKITKILGNF